MPDTVAAAVEVRSGRAVPVMTLESEAGSCTGVLNFVWNWGCIHDSSRLKRTIALALRDLAGRRAARNITANLVKKLNQHEGKHVECRDLSPKQ